MTDDRAEGLTDEARGAGTTPEDRDPVMEKIAAGILEFLDTIPPRTHFKRVGWGWWYELQGEEPEPEDKPEFDGSDIWSIRDWFDGILEEMEAKAKAKRRPTKTPTPPAELTQEERGVNDGHTDTR